MSLTLAQVRANVRTDLGDTDATNYRWTDAAIDRFVDRARLRLQETWPRQRTVDLTAVAGQRDYALTTVTDLLWVERVLFDATVEHYPRLWTPFSVYGNQPVTMTLTLLRTTAPAGGEKIRLFYGGVHVLDGTGNTLPAEYEDLLAQGGAVYAEMEEAARTPGRFNASSETADEWRKLVQARSQAWERALGAMRRLYGSRIAGADWGPGSWALPDELGSVGQ